VCVQHKSQTAILADYECSRLVIPPVKPIARHKLFHTLFRCLGSRIIKADDEGGSFDHSEALLICLAMLNQKLPILRLVSPIAHSITQPVGMYSHLPKLPDISCQNTDPRLRFILAVQNCLEHEFHILKTHNLITILERNLEEMATMQYSSIIIPGYLAIMSRGSAGILETLNIQFQDSEQIGTAFPVNDAIGSH